MQENCFRMQEDMVQAKQKRAQNNFNSCQGQYGVPKTKLRNN